MLGNVGEWVINPDGHSVVIGGSYIDEAEDVACDKVKTQKPNWNITDPQNPKSRWWLSDAWFVGFGSCVIPNAEVSISVSEEARRTLASWARRRKLKISRLIHRHS